MTYCDKCEINYCSKSYLVKHLKSDKHKKVCEYILYFNIKNKSMKFRELQSYNNYIMYEDGEIMNIITKNKVNVSIKIKMISVCLRDNNDIYKTISYRRLIYETWNDIKLTDKDKIKFKDNNKNNFHYTNLINVNGPDKHLTHMSLDPTKEWKIIEGFDDYKISNYGDIFSIISNKLLSKSVNEEGYEMIRLTKNDERPGFSIHRLVFRTFSGEIPENKVVDHINRISSDNYVGNLRLLTYSENNINRSYKKSKFHEIYQYTLDNKFLMKWESAENIEINTGFSRKGIYECAIGKIKSSSGFIWKYPENVRITNLSGFKIVTTNDKFTYSKYKINEDGIVINKNNFILTPGKHDGYKFVVLKSDSIESHHYFVHRLVAMTFLPNTNPKYNIVNHLDEDKSNANVNNLQWTDHTGNVKYSLGKKVNQICLKTGEILFTYDSVRDANVGTNKPKDNTCIYDTCNGKQNTSNGFGWEYV
jgi:hypothetical protein